MRGHGGVIDDDLGVAHQAVAILDVSGKPGERVHHPEFGEGEIDALAVPLRVEALQIQRERAALDHVLDGVRRGEKIAAAKQCRDARAEMRQARVLGEVVVRAQAKPRNDIEVGVARRQKDDRHIGRQRAQLAA